MTDAARPSRLRAHAGWALAGTVLAFVLLLLDVRASGQGILRPIRAGAEGPAAQVVGQDFPGRALPDYVGVDGQQFYAIARDPFHADAVAESLDRPQYRYQRPLYPMLAWLLHPTGGGPGLVWAFVVVSLAALFVGGLALGVLSDLLRGPPWLAMLYPVLPGAVWSLTTSAADGLAVSLSLVTIVATLKGRSRLAVVAAVAAVLTRETTIIVPLALLLARRRKADLPLLLVPAAAIGAWLVLVRSWVPSGGLPSERLVFPLSGFVNAVTERWLHGQMLIGMAATLAAFVAGAFVLARGRGPRPSEGLVELRWVVALQLAFLSVCSGAVLGDDFGGTRSTFLLLAVGIAVLVAGSRSPVPAPAAPALVTDRASVIG